MPTEIIRRKYIARKKGEYRGQVVDLVKETISDGFSGIIYLAQIGFWANIRAERNGHVLSLYSNEEAAKKNKGPKKHITREGEYKNLGYGYVGLYKPEKRVKIIG